VKGGDFEVDSQGFTLNQLIFAEGTYNVSFGGLRGSFTVKPKKPFEAIVNDFQVHPLGIEVEDEDDVWTFRIARARSEFKRIIPFRNRKNFMSP